PGRGGGVVLHAGPARRALERRRRDGGDRERPRMARRRRPRRRAHRERAGCRRRDAPRWRRPRVPALPRPRAPAAPGSRPPWRPGDPSARGVLAGLTLAHDRGHIARAVLEAAALSIRHVAEHILEAGVRVDTMRVCGGPAHSETWNRIKADVTGFDVLVPRSF